MNKNTIIAPMLEKSRPVLYKSGTEIKKKYILLLLTKSVTK